MLKDTPTHVNASHVISPGPELGGHMLPGDLTPKVVARGLWYSSRLLPPLPGGPWHRAVVEQMQQRQEVLQLEHNLQKMIKKL